MFFEVYFVFNFALGILFHLIFASNLILILLISIFFVFYYFLDYFFFPISPPLFFSLSLYIKFGSYYFDCDLFCFFNFEQ